MISLFKQHYAPVWPLISSESYRHAHAFPYHVPLSTEFAAFRCRKPYSGTMPAFLSSPRHCVTVYWCQQAIRGIKVELLRSRAARAHARPRARTHARTHSTHTLHTHTHTYTNSSVRASTPPPPSHPCPSICVCVSATNKHK